MHAVGLARGENSYDAVTEALALIRDQVTIPTDRPVLIKPTWWSPIGHSVPRRYGSNVTSLAFTPDGKSLVSGSHDATVKIWDVEKGGEVTSLEQNDKMYSVGASKDGKCIAASGKERSLMVWKLK